MSAGAGQGCGAALLAANPCGCCHCRWWRGVLVERARQDAVREDIAKAQEREQRLAVLVRRAFDVLHTSLQKHRYGRTGVARQQPVVVALVTHHVVTQPG